MPISALLRRVKLAAAKLGLGAVEDWVDQELQGYTSDVPEYRVLQGQPMVRNPYSGWSPIGGSVKGLSKRGNGQSIAEIEHLLANAAKGDGLHIRYSDSICRALDKTNGVAGWYWGLQVSPSALAGILDRVRTLVLEWAINMERAGVLGSEFNFDKVEKQKAREVGMTINIGSIGAFTGNLGEGNRSGDVTANDVSVAQLHDVLAQIRQHAGELEAAGAERVLVERIAALEAEMAKASPDRTIVRGFLTDIRNALTGAAGNLLASGAMPAINQILGAGVPSP